MNALFSKTSTGFGKKKIIDINSDNFNDTITHFGQQFVQLGTVSPSNALPITKGRIATPASINAVKVPSPSAMELLIQQQAFSRKIPPLVRGIIGAWAIFNITGLIFWMLHIALF